MRSVMPQPCMGCSRSAFSTSMSSVPCRRSPRSLPIRFLSIDERSIRKVAFDRQGEGAHPYNRAVMRALLIVAAMSACVPAMAEAGVTTLQIDRREVVLNGRPFGAAGPYEKLAGKVHFALDPALPQNRVIVDLNLAPKSARGLVEFSADFYLLKPVDASRGNGRLFYEAGNRGSKRILPVFQDAANSADPATAEEFGNG